MLGFHIQNMLACFCSCNFQQTLLLLEYLGHGCFRYFQRKFMMAPFNEIFLVQQWIFFLRMDRYLYLLLFREQNATYLSFLPISPTLFSTMFYSIFITCILSKEFLVRRKIWCFFSSFLRKTLPGPQTEISKMQFTNEFVP